MATALTVWTIGHSNLEFGAFESLLHENSIEYLVDVRTSPYSRYADQFNREALEYRLGQDDADIGYLYLGQELGGRPSNSDHYDENGHALYDLMASECSFQAAIERLMRGARTYRLALLCSEARPEHCHRRLLVGRVLTDFGVELRHVLPDGTTLKESAVEVNAAANQECLFGAAPAWRSTQSVLQKRPQRTSSGA